MKYAIFGPGRVGGNMAAYLTGLGHEVRLLARAEATVTIDVAQQAVKSADIVAAAIPDDLLVDWCNQWKQHCGERPMVHFSGAAQIDSMSGFHPLYSFPKTIVDFDIMKRIAFARPERGPRFTDIFPAAPNPSFPLKDADRARYHALAVLAGNLPAFLWNETAASFEALADTPADMIMGPYLASLVDRFTEQPLDSLTGPIARKDRKTVEANLSALQETPDLYALYLSFLNRAWPEYPD